MSLEPFQIVPATVQDGEWAARWMAAHDPWDALGLTAEACRSAAERPGSALYVAHERDRRIGFIVLQRYGVASAPYVQSIGVVPEARGRGVGSALLAFAEDLYRGQARWLFICVSSFNPRARTLYERHGYTVVAELPGHLVDAASETLMRKPIAERR